MSRRRLDLDPLDLDGNTAERILAGSVPPADAPPGYAGVARTLEAAARPPDPAELGGEVEAVALIVSHLAPGPETRPARCRLARRLPVLAACAVGFSLTSGLAVAGALPGFAQDAAATVLGTVGVDIPGARPEPADRDGTPDGTPGGPTGDGAATPRPPADGPPPAQRSGPSAAHAPGPDGPGGAPDETRGDRSGVVPPAPEARPPAAGGLGGSVSAEASGHDGGLGHGGAVCAVASRGRCPSAPPAAAGGDPRPVGDGGEGNADRPEAGPEGPPPERETPPADGDREPAAGPERGLGGDQGDGRGTAPGHEDEEAGTGLAGRPGTGTGAPAGEAGTPVAPGGDDDAGDGTDAGRAAAAEASSSEG